MLFPVRYADFDQSDNPENGQGEGVVEKYIKPWISKVDMIITVSQALEGDYNIDVYGTSRRGGGDDNLFMRREKNSKALETDLEWIKTTLNKGFTKINGVKYIWTYNIIEDGEVNPPKKDDIILSGSGGNYLSNEIFYRVGKMRSEMRSELQTGHFHISKIQDKNTGEDLKQNEVKELIEKCVKAISEGIKSI